MPSLHDPLDLVFTRSRIYHPHCWDEAPGGHNARTFLFVDDVPVYEEPQFCYHCGDVVRVPLSEIGLNLLSALDAAQRVIAARLYRVRIARCSECGNIFVGRCQCRRARDLPEFSFVHDCI